MMCVFQMIYIYIYLCSYTYIVTQQIKCVSYPLYMLLYRGHCPYYSIICCGLKAQTIMGHGEANLSSMCSQAAGSGLVVIILTPLSPLLVAVNRLPQGIWAYANQSCFPQCLLGFRVQALVLIFLLRNPWKATDVRWIFIENDLIQSHTRVFFFF